MTEDFHPSAAGSASSSSPPEFEIEEIGHAERRWRMEVRPSDLALYEDDDPNPFIVLREQIHRDVNFSEGIRGLMIQRPRKLAFRLSPEAVQAVADWFGEGAMAGIYLKRRYSWVLPVALIWMVGSLPLPANPSVGVEAVPFDLVGMLLGAALVVAWCFSRWRPHSILFLVDSLWFLFLTFYLVEGVFSGRSKLWMILVGILLWMAINGFKYFARFRKVEIQPSKGR